MGFTTVRSMACLGISACPIRVEADVTFGLPQLTIVGLPDTSVRESRERVKSAIKNSGYRFPSDRVTINLAPADIKKEGPAFDLPIAIGILAASGLIPDKGLNQYIFLGELALDGSLRPFQGALIATSSLKTSGQFLLPFQSAHEAALEKKATVYPAKHLNDVIRFLSGDQVIRPYVVKDYPMSLDSQDAPDFSDVKGQLSAKRALEIAVAGGHNLLLIGPPGSGKTMLASRIPSILPPLHFDEALEITKINSLKPYPSFKPGISHQRPFRSPHHSISPAAMTGGGSWPKPGEISLSHGGVLFLDEFPEFRRDVLEALRSPLERGEIDLSRTKMQTTFPSRFMLVAAMNPCPCGYLTAPKRTCRCTSVQIQKYQSKVSGPILDRMDLHVEVPSLSFEKLKSNELSESSAAIQKRVLECRKKQCIRFTQSSLKLNALMRPRDLKKWANLNEESSRLIEIAMKELHLSARAYYKIIKIARTIADLAGGENIQSEHIAEAIQYRTLDRQW